MSRVTTQATDILLYENILCNQAGLDRQSASRPVPFINSDRLSRTFALAPGLRFYLLRRIHIVFMSNLKLRVVKPTDQEKDEAEAAVDTVVYGDATSSFTSSNYQKYIFTFEQQVSLWKHLSGEARPFFRFDQELLNAYPAGLLDSTKREMEEKQEIKRDKGTDGHLSRNIRK